LRVRRVLLQGGVAFGFRFGLRGAPAFDAHHLLDDFVRQQIAFPTIQTARAEFAAVRTADLRGDTERVAIAAFAVERRVGRDQHAFDERMIGEPPEEFLRGVACALFADEFEGAEGVFVPQFFAQHLGQIGHRLPIRDALDIEPVHQLFHAINGLFPRGELGFQFLARQGFDVGRHAGSVVLPGSTKVVFVLLLTCRANKD
jgi:hypothetical protein